MVANEMLKIEADFYKTPEAAQEYLESQKDDASSVASDILSKRGYSAATGISWGKICQFLQKY